MIRFFLSLIFCFQLCNADPLPSWNDGAVKEGILQFVRDVTDENGKYFVPVEERIATFDQDGTLWVEQPLYTQLFFSFDRLKSISTNNPDPKMQCILSLLNGHIDKLTEEDIVFILKKTSSGMSVDSYHAMVSSWLSHAVHPRYKRPFTQLIYKPMLEVMDLFKANGFKVYIVSGGGTEFMRAYAENVYGVPPERTIGSTGEVRYEYQDGHPILLKLPELLFLDDKGGKPEAINLIIGRRPIAAFGNSDGDRQMLEWTDANKGKSLKLLVHHDDAEREYAYDKDSKVGTFSTSLMDEAKKKNWFIVSMKNDWKVLFP